MKIYTSIGLQIGLSLPYLAASLLSSSSNKDKIPNLTTSSHQSAILTSNSNNRVNNFSSFQISYGTVLLAFLSGASTATLIANGIAEAKQNARSLLTYSAAPYVHKGHIVLAVMPALLGFISQFFHTHINNSLHLSSLDQITEEKESNNHKLPSSASLSPFGGALAWQALGWNAMLVADLLRGNNARLLICVLGGIGSMQGAFKQTFGPTHGNVLDN